MANGGQFLGDQAIDQLAEIAAMTGFDPEVEADVRNAIMGGGGPTNPVAQGPGAQPQPLPDQGQPSPQPLSPSEKPAGQGAESARPQSPIAGQAPPAAPPRGSPLGPEDLTSAPARRPSTAVRGSVPEQGGEAPSPAPGPSSIFETPPPNVVGQGQLGQKQEGAQPAASVKARENQGLPTVIDEPPGQGTVTSPPPSGRQGAGAGEVQAPQQGRGAAGGGGGDFAGVRANVPTQDMNRSQVDTEKLGQALSALAELNTQPPQSPPPASVGAAGQVSPFLLPLFQQPLTTRGGQ